MGYNGYETLSDDSDILIRQNGDKVQTHNCKYSINNKQLANYMKQFSVS